MSKSGNGFNPTFIYCGKSFQSMRLGNN